MGWLGGGALREKGRGGFGSFKSNSVSDTASLQYQVALAVSQAWWNFREGKIAFAERAIGQIPDTDIFVVPPSRTGANRWDDCLAWRLVDPDAHCPGAFFLVWHSG